MDVSAFDQDPDAKLAGTPAALDRADSNIDDFLGRKQGFDRRANDTPIVRLDFTGLKSEAVL